jgi:glycosyltransferase involved in cell wall biosynthesis
MPQRRLRVLMASIVDPAVQRGGAWTVTRGIVSLLRQAATNAELTVTVPREPSWRRLRQFSCLALARWTGMPAKVRFLRARSFRKRIGSLLARNHFDLFIINGSDLLWCIDEVSADTPVIVVVHNRESQLFADQVASSTPPIGVLRNMLSNEASRLFDFELDGLKRAGAAIFLSATEAREFSSRIPGLLHLVLPPQFTDAPQREEKPPSDHLDLGLLANFRWWPNRKGTDWFIREILSHLPDDVRLHLFGLGSTEINASHSRVITHGFTKDLGKVWKTCDWMVIPIHYGSGVSVKAAESLYHGMPVVSTPFGLRGLTVPASPRIVRCETPAEWVAFLSSNEARTLCHERLPPDMSRCFELESNLPRFTRFLSRIVHQGENRVSPSYEYAPQPMAATTPSADAGNHLERPFNRNLMS